MSDGRLAGRQQLPQSAALPYRVQGSRIEVLLVTPRGGEGWIIPKGKVKPRLGPAQSALCEAEEEAGVRGEIDDEPFDQYRHGGGEDGPLVAVHLMRVTREMSVWPERHERTRRWVTLELLPQLVVDPGLARVMRDAAVHLAANAPAGWLAAESAWEARRIRRRRLAGSALLLAAGSALAAIALLAG